MRALVGVLVAAGCFASQRPAPPGNAGVDLPPPPKQLPLIAKAPRPEIDVQRYLPDFHDELRWPLTAMAHPKLEPSYAIANALAAPGIGWLDLCAVGAQSRHMSGNQEIVEYLHGWCSVAKGDVDNACRYLRPLLGSLTLGNFVRTDLANILVDLGDADKAEHWIAKHHIGDLQILDLLAASFVEIGQDADAAVINRHAIDSDSAPTAATKCRRLTRRIVLRKDVVSWDYEKQLEDMIVKAKVPDPTCLKLTHMLWCSKEPAKNCALYLDDEHIDPAVQDLLYLYFEWPYEGDYAKWHAMAVLASQRLALEGADEIAVTALEAALRANLNACSNELVTLMHDVRARVATRLQPRLDTLLTRCTKI